MRYVEHEVLVTASARWELSCGAGTGALPQVFRYWKRDRVRNWEPVVAMVTGGVVGSQGLVFGAWVQGPRRRYVEVFGFGVAVQELFHVIPTALGVSGILVRVRTVNTAGVIRGLVLWDQVGPRVGEGDEVRGSEELVGADVAHVGDGSGDGVKVSWPTAKAAAPNTAANANTAAPYANATPYANANAVVLGGTER